MSATPNPDFMDVEGFKAWVDETSAEQARGAHALYVLWVSATIEDRLEQALRCQMPKLTKNLAERLFQNYGPFSSFAAKIDVLFAMGLLSDALWRDLKAIKDTRNNFAHPKKMITDNDNIVKSMSKFIDFKPSDDAFVFFRKKINECIEAIDKILSLTASGENRQPDTSQ